MRRTFVRPLCGAAGAALALAAVVATAAPLPSGLAELPWVPDEGRELLGAPAPEWTNLRWLRGGPLTLGGLRGKVVLVRFWLTGCPYCTRTAPALNELHREYASRGLVVVGIHHPKSEESRDPAVVRKAATELGFRFPVATDDAWATLDRYWTRGADRDFTSVTFLIDRSGRIRFLHDGGEFFPGAGEPGRAYEAMETMVRRLLDER